MTAIEWTQRPGTKGEVWNPVVGCTRASAGCDHCYAVTMTHRLEGMGQEKYRGLTVLNPRGDRHFNGVVRTVPEALTIPLHWKKPRTVFVNSMSDMFHDKVPFDFIDRVFAVMALCPQHTFQILTKRPERMAEYLNTPDRMDRKVWEAIADLAGQEFAEDHEPGTWPRPNVWLGTSVERQPEADERVPHLQRCPAAVRFLSCEPLLGRVDLKLGRPGDLRCRQPYINWVIVGGESGPHARPCDVAWIRSIVGQCRAARVPVFVKQLGARPWVLDENEEDVIRCMHCGCTGSVQAFDCLGADRDNLFCNKCGCEIRNGYGLADPKGGDPAEWREDLRVREWPGVGGEA